MFTTVEKLQTEDQFLKELFNQPSSKLVSTSKFMNELTVEDFYNYAYENLGFINVRPKRFIKHKSLQEQLLYNLKNLCFQKKYDRELRPHLAGLYYNVSKNEMVGTDCYIMFIDSVFLEKTYLGPDNLFINKDELNNITYTKETEINEKTGLVYYPNGKYPEYDRVFPDANDEDEKYTMSDNQIDRLFHFQKVCKAFKVINPTITIKNIGFNVDYLCRLIEVIKRNNPEHNITLNLSTRTRATYLIYNEGRTRALIMPIVIDYGTLFLKLF